MKIKKLITNIIKEKNNENVNDKNINNSHNLRNSKKNAKRRSIFELFTKKVLSQKKMIQKYKMI
jgi:hypothetical protein